MLPSRDPPPNDAPHSDLDRTPTPPPRPAAFAALCGGSAAAYLAFSEGLHAHLRLLLKALSVALARL